MKAEESEAHRQAAKEPLQKRRRGLGRLKITVANALSNQYGCHGIRAPNNGLEAVKFLVDCRLWLCLSFGLWAVSLQEACAAQQLYDHVFHTSGPAHLLMWVNCQAGLLWWTSGRG